MQNFFQVILTIILSFVRHLPQDQAIVMANAVADTAQTKEELAMLLTVSYYETGFRSRGRVIPFGLSGAPRACLTGLAYCAGVSLRSLRRAARCSRRMESVLGFYHTGRCTPDPYSIREAASYRIILGRLQNAE